MDELEKISIFDQTYAIKDEGRQGMENRVSSIAFNVPENIDPKEIEYKYVLKEPRGINYFEALEDKFPPKNQAEKQAYQKLVVYLDSKEHFMDSANDYKYMKGIFGDLIPKTYYIIGEPTASNKSGFYILQEKVVGKTWTEYAKNKSWQENKEFLMIHRDQLIDLIGGARKILVETGSLVDIWGDNIMIDESGKIVLIDPGSPSLLAKLYENLKQLPKEARAASIEPLINRARDLRKYPELLEMSSDEIEKMNEKFGITQTEYENASQRFIDMCEGLKN